MPHAIIPRILFIDAYDSFTNNIISLLESDLSVEVTIIKIDDTIEDFVEFLGPFAAVIAGPGPGHPKNVSDVGLFNRLWVLDPDHTPPVLGICLGFQSLVQAFGGRVKPLPEPRHGIIRRIRHADTALFRGAGNIDTVQYHSLHASLDYCHGSGSAVWNPTGSCPDLRPLAWDIESDNPTSDEATPTKNPNSILMAVEHTTKPFCGIQFHPESICSNQNARKIISTWWSVARKWKTNANPSSSVELSPIKSSMKTTKSVSMSIFIMNQFDKGFPELLKRPKSGEDMYLASIIRDSIRTHKKDPSARTETPESGNDGPISPLKVITKVLDLGTLKVPQLCEKLGIREGEAVVFDSEVYQRPEIGEHSIIGLVTPSSLKLEYTTGIPWVRQVQDGTVHLVNLRDYGGKIFDYLKHFMKQHKTDGGNVTVPFWGGLMGYITYEACLETIDLHPPSDISQNTRLTARPDLSFVYIERSIVVNFQQQKLYIQSIKPNDNLWIFETASLLLRTPVSFNTSPSSTFSFQSQISRPNEIEYKSKIRDCQTSIRAGDAYEICLTTQSTIKTPPDLPSWPLYLRLRGLNPSPFSAYLRLGPLTLLSSSPERFLSWSRPSHKEPSFSPTATSKKFHSQRKTSTCQFRPIKGTVQKLPKNPNLPPVTLAKATALLSDPKERAENLMIVDLIRHDLHGVIGSGNVRVEKLMVVEEYATLFQLVTVIEGDLQLEADTNPPATPAPIPNHSPASSPPTSSPSHKPRPPNKTGLDVLAASLPPGSMTGAPKRRACQLLQDLEPRARGVYSGVLGYLDVGGGGDFAVVIRSAFRWDDDKREFCASSKQEEAAAEGKDGGDAPTAHARTKTDTWGVGAGGAVTVLSSVQAEWEEMGAKMGSTMKVFGGGGGDGVKA